MEEFLVNVINEYIIYYKKLKNLPDDFTLFDGINIYDDTSTNVSLEEFYDAKYSYDHNGEKYIKIYDDVNEIKDKYYEIYVMLKNNIEFKYSPSLFSLLIEIVNLKNEDSDNVYLLRKRT
jgi:hypothetical protein